MLEVRATIPGCARFESFGYDRLDIRSLARKTRVLRAPLPSVKELPFVTWGPEIEACLCEVKAPFLTSSSRLPDDENELLWNRLWKMFEATPALQAIYVNDADPDSKKLGAKALIPLTTALRLGALPNLQKVELYQCDTVEAQDVWDFANALEHFGCANRYMSLRFNQCELSGDGVRAFAGPPSRGAFPALEELDFQGNDRIGDECGVAIGESLLTATQTRLRSLDLSQCGFGDKALVALASVIDQGRFEVLKDFYLSSNIDDVSDQGIIVLARAIDARGLPMLETFAMKNLRKPTAIGISAIIDALIKGCPKLKTIVYDHWEIDGNIVKGTFQAAGRGNVDVVTSDEWEKPWY